MNRRECSRCHGTMMLEEFLGETELVCLQCSNRIDAPEFRKRGYTAAQAKKAA